MEKPEQRPEGRLLAEALKRSKLSARKAAALAGMSDGRWGQIVRGYQTMGDAVYAPVRAPAETLARMAQVVGLTHEDFVGVRDDVVEQLLDLEVAERMKRSDVVNADSEEIIRRIQRRLAGADKRQLEALEQWVETFFPDVDLDDEGEGGDDGSSAIA